MNLPSRQRQTQGHVILEAPPGAEGSPLSHKQILPAYVALAPDSFPDYGGLRSASILSVLLKNDNATGFFALWGRGSVYAHVVSTDVSPRPAGELRVTRSGLCSARPGNGLYPLGGSPTHFADSASES